MKRPVKVLHFAELLLHIPNAKVQHVQLEEGETKQNAVLRFLHVHGNALTAVAFYDRAQMVIGGLTFTSEIINMQKPIVTT